MGVCAAGSYGKWWLLPADQLGGVYLEGRRQLADSARVRLVYEVGLELLAHATGSERYSLTSHRDCPKRVCWLVIRYCSTHEKNIPNRPLRCRVGIYKASPAYSESCW